MIAEDAHLSTADRPKNLLRAARSGLLDYDRRRALRRILGPRATSSSAETLDRLARLEARADSERRAGLSTYSPMRHVELLAAIFAETRLVRA